MFPSSQNPSTVADTGVASPTSPANEAGVSPSGPTFPAADAGAQPSANDAGSTVDASPNGGGGNDAGPATVDAGAATDDAGQAGPGNAALPDCNWKDEPAGPCGTFTTSSGTKIQLGPYGAVLERNVGKGFEVKVSSSDTNPATCAAVVASFGESKEDSAPLLDVEGIDWALYSVYRPANWVEGETYPIITWGNGTCAKPEGYGALLRYVASHGFFVIAANSRWVGGNSAMTKALDFAFAATKDPSSPYYNRLDTTKVGAMGHSQGGMATISAASDKRINAVIIWNGGGSAVKPFLAVSGEMDIGNPPASKLAGALTGNPPGAYLYYHKVIGQGSVRGHLTLMTQPERVVEPATAWFKYQLLGDADSRSYFVGSDCKLCGMPDEFDYGQKGLQ